MALNRNIFSSRNACTKVLVSLAAVGMMMAYAGLKPPLPTIEQCLANPARYEGALVSTGSGGKIQRIEPWGFWMKRKAGDVRMVGSSAGLHRGEVVFLEAVFHKEGYFEIKQLYESRYRHIRILASMAGLIGVFWLFSRNYQFNEQK